jgi:hypothetical protein
MAMTFEIVQIFGKSGFVSKIMKNDASLDEKKDESHDAFDKFKEHSIDSDGHRFHIKNCISYFDIFNILEAESFFS